MANNSVLINPAQAKASNQKAKIKSEYRKRRPQVLSVFKKWVQKDHQSMYDMYTPIGPLILIRLFLYEPPLNKNEQTVFTSWEDDGSGMQNLKSEMFPFVKVLRVGTNLPEDYKHLKPGDIVAIPDDMCGVELNTEWKEWQFMKREKPSIDEDWPMPPRYLPTLSNWQRYVFRRDKFMPGNMNEDAYTFMIPCSLVRTMVDISLIK